MSFQIASPLSQKKSAKIEGASIAIGGRDREAHVGQEEDQLLTKQACIVAAGVTAHTHTDAATAEINTKNAPILMTIALPRFMFVATLTTSMKRICADIFQILDLSRRSL